PVRVLAAGPRVQAAVVRAAPVGISRQGDARTIRRRQESFGFPAGFVTERDDYQASGVASVDNGIALSVSEGIQRVRGCRAPLLQQINEAATRR
ncbi:unnamed protein product, partial [Closterium sp. NIES-53]